MTEFIEGGQPEVGDHLDESAVVPAPKAYAPPFQHLPDELRVRVRLDRGGVSIDGKAKVLRGLGVPIGFGLLTGVALGFAWGVVELALRCSAPGWVALALGAIGCGAVLTAGMTLWSKHKQGSGLSL